MVSPLMNARHGAASAAGEGRLFPVQSIKFARRGPWSSLSLVMNKGYDPPLRSQPRGKTLRRHGQAAAVAAFMSLALLAPSAQAAEAKDPIGELIDQAIEVSTQAAMKITATLYHSGAPGIRGLDSLGCSVSPMRTLAV